MQSNNQSINQMTNRSLKKWFIVKIINKPEMVKSLKTNTKTAIRSDWTYSY